MNTPHLNRHHARILEEILDHRGRNIEWPDVLSLMQHLGNAVERHDGKYEFQIGSTSEVFTKPRDKDVGVDELALLRRFLTTAGVTAAPQTLPAVLLIDHHQARFFEPDPKSGHLQEQDHLEPTDAQNMERIMKEGQFEGERAPEAIDYFERIAQRLQSDRAVVLAGDATAKSSAMLGLLEYLKDKRKEIASRIVGTQDVDVSSFTLPEIDQIAKSHAGTH